MKNSLLSIFILFFFISNSWADHDSHNDFFKCLAINSLSSLIYTRTNSSYQTLFDSTSLNRRPLSRFTSLKPIAIITPLQESQIPFIIRCSKLYGIQIKTRSGGHDFEGLSYISESTFVILDMRNLRLITIDDDKKTSWAQTGATLGELYYAIANTSRTLAFPAGLCPTVCIGGHFTSGGYGMISRKFGLAIDHIIDARIVDVNGRVLDRESMGEDLFWAIRGGGGASFGVVLALKLNLVSVPETVTVFNITRTSEKNVIDLVEKSMHIADKIDDKLVLRVLLQVTFDEVKQANQTIEVTFIGVYLGRVDNLIQLMQENFTELRLLRKECTEMSWIESILYIYKFPGGSNLDVLLNRPKDQTAVYYKAKSDFLTEPIPKEGLLGLWKRMHERIIHFEMEILPYGGRMNDISESDTPFPHRLGTRYMIEYIVAWIQPNDITEVNVAAQIHMKWIRELYKYMGLYASKNPRGAYFNYPDLDLGTDNQESIRNTKSSIWGVQYFKNNFKRLVKVKSKFDPTNFFRHEQSIPVSHQIDDLKDIKEVIKKNADIISH